MAVVKSGRDTAREHAFAIAPQQEGAGQLAERRPYLEGGLWLAIVLVCGKCISAEPNRDGCLPLFLGNHPGQDRLHRRQPRIIGFSDDRQQLKPQIAVPTFDEFANRGGGKNRLPPSTPRRRALRSVPGCGDPASSARRRRHQAGRDGRSGHRALCCSFVAWFPELSNQIEAVIPAKAGIHRMHGPRPCAGVTR